MSNAYLELRRQCDSLIAEMADLQAERDKAQAACAAMTAFVDAANLAMTLPTLPDDDRLSTIRKAGEVHLPWWGRRDNPGQALLAELKQLRALRQAVLAFQAVERSWVRGNDVPWGEAVDKALDVMYSAALAAKEAGK